MSGKSSSAGSRSGKSSITGAVSQLFATGAIGGVASMDTGVPITDADVVAGIDGLTIVTNAEGVAKDPTTAVTGAKSTASAVTEVFPLFRTQVNADVANNLNAQVTGAIPKLNSCANVNINPVRSSNAVVNPVVNAKSNARLDPNRRIHITRYSHCELCSERDSSRMVQCDGCEKWYHFSCVEVASDLKNQSWICPKCPYMHINASNRSQQVQPVDPPPNIVSSRKSTGKSRSNRSQRKIDLLLRKLEEQKQLEQKYLEEKYRILDEEDDGDVTVVSDDDVSSVEIAKIRGWLRDTDNCSEYYDSGLVEEDVNEDQLQPIVHHAPVPGQTEPRSTIHDFVPNQRSTPQEATVMDPRTRSRVVQVPAPTPLHHRASASVPEKIFHQSAVHYGESSQPIAVASGVQFRRPPASISDAPSPAYVADNQDHRSQTFRPAQVSGNQVIQSQAPRPAPQVVNQPQVPRTAPAQSYQESRSAQNPRVQLHHSQHFRVTPAPGIPVARPIPAVPNDQILPEPSVIPETQGRNPAVPMNHNRQGFGNPESAPRNVEENVHTLNKYQVVARQVVSKDLPEFYGNPEDWPLFFSMFTSSTQMCGFPNEENMLRLRKCLKGKALEAVRCRLLHPTNVDGVMSTLKMLYGRPEAIVQASIRKIRSLASPQVEKLDTLINFALTVENLVATIEACGVEDFIYNAALKVELVDRLPAGLKLDWAKHCRNNPAPNLLHFSQWLYSMAEDASAVMQTSSSAPRSRGTKNDGFINVHSDAEQERSRSTAAKARAVQGSSSTPVAECVTCKGSCPVVAKCKRFAELSLDAKWAVVREARLCRKCLRKHNGSCRQQKPCGTKGCTFLHHPMLHNEKQEVPATGNSNVHQAQTSEVLFRIVPVVLHGPSNVVKTYAFIDDGSELTLMEESLAEELGVKGPRTPLCLKWTGGTKKMENASQKVEVEISAIGNSSKAHRMSGVHTIQDLQLRPQTLVYHELQQRYQHLGGLPVESYSNVCPRILIGLDHASLGHALKSRERKPFEPIAVKTRLVWIVYGSCSQTQRQLSYVNVHTIKVCECQLETDENLHTAMKNYFTLDSLGVAKPEKILRSTEDQRAMEMLEQSTIPKDGRYESGLLWKYEDVRFPNNKGMAYRRWQCLDRRMKKDEEFTKTVSLSLSLSLIDHPWFATPLLIENS